MEPPNVGPEAQDRANLDTVRQTDDVNHQIANFHSDRRSGGELPFSPVFPSSYPKRREWSKISLVPDPGLEFLEIENFKPPEPRNLPQSRHIR